VVGPSPEGSGEDDGDLEVARRKAREILFDGKDPEAEPEPEAKPKPVEPPKPKAEEKDEIALSKKWAKVTAQEDRLVKRQKEHAAKEDALKEREAKIAAAEQKMNDPVAYLAERGWTKDQIVQWIQSDGKVDPEILVKQLDERHRKEIEELRAERAKEREELENTRRQRDMERVTSELAREVKHLYLNDSELSLVKTLVEKNPKKFESFMQSRVEQIIRTVWDREKQVVDPRDALLYAQQELAELQLANPGQAPAVKPATPVAVEPTPITNGATSSRTVRPVDYDESDPEARRAKAARILAGEEEAE
jgi:hypothetical protein